MPHVDDGKLNAMLDGELDAAETASILAHVAECAECGERLEQAKRFLADADDLLGVLELPPTRSAAGAETSTPPLPRATGSSAAPRPSRTAKEIAVDVDGVTQQSPAIHPDQREAASVFRNRIPPRRFDYGSLAWAATIVLAIGVGFLANEVRHGRQALRPPEPPRTAAAAARTEAEPPAAPAAPTAKAAAPRRPQAPPKTLNVREPTSLGHKRLAERPRAAGAARGRPAPRAAEAAAALQSDRTTETQTAGRLDAPARPPAARETQAGSAGGAAARSPLAGVAGDAGAVRAAVVPPTFRRATLEEAVDRLRGAIRLIDGMQSTRVEVGPGALVPGASREREVVRVFYDDAGRQVLLDQQRVGGVVSAAGAAAAPDSVSTGMSPGDTLLTATPGGELRMRWVDRQGFWVSLTAPLPVDSLRRLAARVH
jgi:Putative zinc-finger